MYKTKKKTHKNNEIESEISLLSNLWNIEIASAVQMTKVNVQSNNILFMCVRGCTEKPLKLFSSTNKVQRYFTMTTIGVFIRGKTVIKDL